MRQHHRIVTQADIVGIALILCSLLIVSFVAGCSADQTKVDNALNSPGGRLFCAFETNGHAQIVGSLIAAGAGVASGPAAPMVSQGVVMATATTAQAAQAACAQAAINIGARAGVPVSPPPAGVVVAQVAIDPATLPVTPVVLPVARP